MGFSKLGVAPKVVDLERNDTHYVDQWFKNVTDRLNTGLPVVLAQPLVNQSLASGVVTKITLGQALIDTDGFFDVSTSKFIPRVAGYYQIDSQLIFDMSAFAGICALQAIIEKNGVQQNLGLTTLSSVAAFYTVTVSFIVSMNGSTDFIEIYGLQNSGAARNVTTGNTVFSANLLRFL